MAEHRASRRSFQRVATGPGPLDSRSFTKSNAVRAAPYNRADNPHPNRHTPGELMKGPLLKAALVAVAFAMMATAALVIAADAKLKFETDTSWPKPLPNNWI